MHVMLSVYIWIRVYTNKAHHAVYAHTDQVVKLQDMHNNHI